MVTGIFFAGVIWNKVRGLERDVKQLGSLSALTVKVTDLVDELHRVRDRLDKWIDSTLSGRQIP